MMLASVSGIGELLAAQGLNRVAVIFDRGALEGSEAWEELLSGLGGAMAAGFCEFSPNPSIDEAVAAAQVVAGSGADAVLAVGGGSCIDVAKVASLGASDPAGLRDRVAAGMGTDLVGVLPVIAVPTTSGSGSEATHFAVVYVDGKKVSVAHEAMLPRAAVLDVRFPLTMPSGLAASSGLDALCHAMESVWAVGSTEVSRGFAFGAGASITETLVESVRWCDIGARSRMMQAAHEAGRAINISKTTASHALSYGLTKRFGIPHGHASALTVGRLAGLNAGVSDADCLDPRGVGHVRGCVERACGMIGTTPAGAAVRLETLLADLGLAPTLGACGVSPEAWGELVRGVDPLRLSNNPRKLGKEEFERLYSA